ncbi:hypothetical protein ACFLY6_01360 [Candidatus Dependentiae bacterium]
MRKLLNLLVTFLVLISASSQIAQPSSTDKIFFKYLGEYFLNDITEPFVTQFLSYIQNPKGHIGNYAKLTTISQLAIANALGSCYVECLYEFTPAYFIILGKNKIGIANIDGLVTKIGYFCKKYNVDDFDGDSEKITNLEFSHIKPASERIQLPLTDKSYAALCGVCHKGQYETLYLNTSDFTLKISSEDLTRSCKDCYGSCKDYYGKNKYIKFYEFTPYYIVHLGKYNNYQYKIGFADEKGIVKRLAFFYIHIGTAEERSIKYIGSAPLTDDMQFKLPIKT